MATYESLPSALTDAVASSPIIGRPLSRREQACAWREIAADVITITGGLAVIHALLEGPFLHPNAVHEGARSLTSALMVGTLCAFTGAYSTSDTPLDIGATEGLVKGLCCAAILSILSRVRVGDFTVASHLFTLGFIGLLLIGRRELCSRLTKYRSHALLRTHVTSMAKLDRHGTHKNSDATIIPTDRLWAKRSVDVCLASVMLFLTMPLFFVVAVLIKLESRGPALLRQSRIGRCGTTFQMWKFRSMYADVARYAPSPTSDADPRVTKVGRILRRFSIDEMPQLLNVLAGDMSLVGPRPEMPFIVAKYSSFERLRLNALPGMTGLWQISPARAMPIHHNADLDLFYISHRSIFLDVAIMLRTVTAVMRGIGAA